MSEKDSIPTAEEFRRELDALLDEAGSRVRRVVEVTSGDLHRGVGGYPGPNHRMPVCCQVMRERMGKDDVVVRQPPSGQGATLTIRYQLGRA
jgi:hypothetical protein